MSWPRQLRLWRLLPWWDHLPCSLLSLKLPSVRAPSHVFACLPWCFWSSDLISVTASAFFFTIVRVLYPFLYFRWCMKPLLFGFVVISSHDIFSRRWCLMPLLPSLTPATLFFLLSQSTSWRLLDCSTISAYPLQPRLSSRCSALPYFSDLYTADLATVISCCWCSLLHLLLLLLVWSDLLLICYYYCSYWYSLNFWVFIEFITGCDIGCYKYFVLFCSSILSIWW